VEIFTIPVIFIEYCNHEFRWWRQFFFNIYLRRFENKDGYILAGGVVFGICGTKDYGCYILVVVVGFGSIMGGCGGLSGG